MHLILDKGNITNLNQHQVNMNEPKPTDKEKNSELNVEDISSVQEIPENVGAIYNQNDEGHRFIILKSCSTNESFECSFVILQSYPTHR